MRALTFSGAVTGTSTPGVHQSGSLTGLVLVVGIAGAALLVYGVMKYQARRRILAWSDEETVSRLWLFMKRLFAKTNGSASIRVKPLRLQDSLGWNSEEFKAVRETLESAGLISTERVRARKLLEDLSIVERREPGAGDMINEYVHITALGAQTVRPHKGSPTAPREFVQTINVSGVGINASIDSSQVQQSVQQHVEITSLDFDLLKQALTQYRRALDGPGLQSPESAAAEDYLSAAQQEVTKAVPDEAKLRAYSDALLQIALGAAGSGLWASIVSPLSHILGH